MTKRAQEEEAFSPAGPSGHHHSEEPLMAVSIC